jgi:pyruvate,water dikinase
MVITSTWGIGEAVVQGRVSTDYFLISRNTDELTSKIALKEKKLVLSNKGLEEKKVPLEFGKKPSLTEEELKLLKQYALILEDYFGSPQDIEYAVDKKAKIFILQTRALRVLVKTTRGEKISSKKEAILEGSSAVSGIAAGPVFVLDGKDLAQVPEGAVLVAKHSSPELSAIVSKVSGIITDLGNPSGHMATVARELQVPAIFGTHKATSILKDGQIVTLDADVGIVYRGRIESLLKTKQELQPLTIKNPKHKKIRETLDLTMPLNLLDPRSSTFSPKHCQTIHDIVRFIHEISIQTMFNLGDKAVYSRKVKVVRLVSHLPVPVYLIDLGGGITERAANAKTIKPDDVFSIPFCALWHGMDHPKIHWSGPIGVNIEGFMSVLMRSMVGAEAQLGEPSYALVSKEYLNFNIRLAYHYSLIDTFCSDVATNNYINFRFFGGGSSAERRSLRAKCIEEILKDLGFAVIREGDLVNAWLKKYPREITEEKLDILGRLMGFMRQLDMLMQNEKVCYAFIDIFKRGDYDLIYQRDFNPIAEAKGS